MTKVSQNNKDFLVNPTSAELDEFKKEIIQNVKLSFKDLKNLTFKFVQFLNGTTKSKFVVISINNSFSPQTNSKIFILRCCLKTFYSYIFFIDFF